MAQFETSKTRYTITDASGRKVELSAEEVDDLLQWLFQGLFDQRNALAEHTRTWQSTPPQAIRDLLDEQQEQLV